jgi:hypothetical protein
MRARYPVVDGKKICTYCLVDKPVEEFGKEALVKSGLKPRCKECISKQNKESNRPSSGYTKQREYQLRKNYKLTEEEYQQMHTEQQGVCWICGKESTKLLHVDHDHDTGEIRGLLCGNCNKAIGLMYDDISILARAIDYLQK